METRAPQLDPAVAPGPPQILARPARAGLAVCDRYVHSLRERGCRTVFGIPGGAIAPFVDRLSHDPHMRFVVTAHESSAVYAASSYGERRSLPGVATVTSGPGILNAMNGIAAAKADQRAVVIIAGEVARADIGRSAVQDGTQHGLCIVESLRPLVKDLHIVHHPDNALAMLESAFERASTHPRGPVLLSLPVDVMGSACRASLTSRAPVLSKPIDEDVLDHILATLTGPGRKLIVVGGGARSPAAGEALSELIDYLPDLRVASTLRGKGAIAESHPQSLGVLGMAGHPEAHEYVARGTDCTLVLGSRLGELATNGWMPGLAGRRQFIQVDVSPEHVGRSYAVDHLVQATVEDFAAALLDRCRRRRAPRTSKPALVGESRSRRRKTQRQTSTARPSAARVLQRLQRCFGPNTCYVVDAGNNLFSCVHYLEIERARDFVGAQSLTSMGSALGLAIGVQSAEPDTPVVAVVGDGGLVMSEGELATLVAQQLPIVVVVFDDGGLGMVRVGHQRIFGREGTWPVAPTDFAALARAHGMPALRVDGADSLDALASFLQHRSGPVLVQAKIDPTAGLPENSRFVTVGRNAEGGDDPS